MRTQTKTRVNPDPRETAADLARVMLLLDASTIARNVGLHLLFTSSRHAEHSHSDLGGCADGVADTLPALQTARLCSWYACASVWITTSFRPRPRIQKHANAWWSMHLHTLLLDTSKAQLSYVSGDCTSRPPGGQPSGGELCARRNAWQHGARQWRQRLPASPQRLLQHQVHPLPRRSRSAVHRPFS